VVTTTPLRFQVGEVPRFLERVSAHVRQGFGPARRGAVAERAVLLAVGQSRTQRFQVVCDTGPALLLITLERDSPFSVVMTFASDCPALVRAVDAELPRWCEETEGDWKEDVLFTRRLLLAELPRLAAQPRRPLEVVRFGAEDFASPCSEQSFEAHRGEKRHFPGALEFWIGSLRAQDWRGREEYFIPYAQGGLCESLTAEEFFRLLGDCAGELCPRLPSFLLPRPGLRSALRMYADWNDVGALAEFPEEYVAFYWSTTA
jgi:hypothetical protein